MTDEELVDALVAADLYDRETAEAVVRLRRHHPKQEMLHQGYEELVEPGYEEMTDEEIADALVDIAERVDYLQDVLRRRGLGGLAT